MKVVFFGTPAFAVPALMAIKKEHQIVAVVTQPDKARDRKGNLILSPVRTEAFSMGLNVLSFDSVKNEGVDILRQMDADVFVTAAYGQILSQQILDIPRLGVYNIHASILPKYRGSSPIQSAIIAGETETGVTIMKTELGLDTGDILLIKKLAIGENETAPELTSRLSELGAKAILEALQLIECRRASEFLTKQDELLATKCSKLTKDSGNIDWTMDAVSICNLIRGLYPTPACHTYNKGRYLRIISAEVVEKTSNGTPGRWQNLRVYCGKGSILITRLQPQDKRILSTAEYVSGYGSSGIFERTQRDS